MKSYKKQTINAKYKKVQQSKSEVTFLLTSKNGFRHSLHWLVWGYVIPHHLKKNFDNTCASNNFNSLVQSFPIPTFPASIVFTRNFCNPVTKQKYFTNNLTFTYLHSYTKQYPNVTAIFRKCNQSVSGRVVTKKV